VGIHAVDHPRHRRGVVLDRSVARAAPMTALSNQAVADLVGSVIRERDEARAERDEAVALLRRAWPVIGTWSRTNDVPDAVEAFLAKFAPAAVPLSLAAGAPSLPPPSAATPQRSISAKGNGAGPAAGDLSNRQEHG
jgi:hypothetical protein